MPYTFVYHPDVADADLPLLPSNIQRRIARAIESRLAEAPERYGTPLRETLRGYWKLRVGDYRVVYQVMGAEVRVLGILHRKRVYEDIMRCRGWPSASA